MFTFRMLTHISFWKILPKHALFNISVDIWTLIIIPIYTSNIIISKIYKISLQLICLLIIESNISSWNNAFTKLKFLPFAINYPLSLFHCHRTTIDVKQHLQIHFCEILRVQLNNKTYLGKQNVPELLNSEFRNLLYLS